MNERGVVALRVTSPCEHGVCHHIKEAAEGLAFSVRECKDSRGIPRSHQVTAEKYPTTVKRR